VVVSQDPDQAEGDGVVGEDPDDVGASVTLLVDLLEGVFDHNFTECALGQP
jgi:hypothetical protein